MQGCTDKWTNRQTIQTLDAPKICKGIKFNPQISTLMNSNKENVQKNIRVTIYIYTFYNIKIINRQIRILHILLYDYYTCFAPSGALQAMVKYIQVQQYKIHIEAKVKYIQVQQYKIHIDSSIWILYCWTCMYFTIAWRAPEGAKHV